MNLKETTYKRNKLYKGKIIDFLVDTVILPNKKKAIREYISNPKAVAVLPFLDSKHLILVKQYRYPPKRITYEIPAGKVDRGENILKCVRRELIEETGYTAKKIKKLTYFFPTPAFSTESLSLYLATELKPTKSNPDKDEFIERIILPIDTVLDWIKKGKICDAKTIIGVLYYILFRRKNNYG